MISCPRCREQLDEEINYCPKCGYQIASINCVNVEPTKKKKTTKGWGIALAIVLLICLFHYFIGDDSPVIEDRHITFVKNGSPSAYPDITYGEAFDSFFSNADWRYFESTDGEDVVEFTGDCIYRDAGVTARIQFILDVDAGTFEVGYLAFNEVPQIKLIEYALIKKAFESYQFKQIFICEGRYF